MIATTPARTAALTCAALVGFASNSLLCRMALAPRAIDAATFTSVRLAAGAATLLAILFVQRRRSRPEPTGGTARSGSLVSAAALFGYAAAFSFAYLRIGAGVGALILFGAVQATMIGVGIAGGERPRPAQWIGLLVALGGLALLTAPGAAAPDPLGAALMAAAGVAWGIYSLRGRRARAPLAATAENFLYGLPFAAALSLATIGGAHASLGGVALAVASGAVASGIGYTLWYAALPRLGTTRAAVLQLTVPALAAAGGAIVLGETVTLRLLAAGGAILGGVAIAVVAPARAQSGERLH